VLRILLIVAVVLGVLADGFFAVVNFYPVAPTRGRGAKRYVVMRLDDAQAAWFQANVLDDFNAEANADLELIHVDDEEQLLPATEDAVKHGKDVVLVGLPSTQLTAALAAKRVRSFATAVDEKTMAADFADLGDKVLASGQVDGHQVFLPRLAILDVAGYRASKVSDAVLHWSALRPEIDAALKRVNGRGLPAGYELSLSPDAWDSFDVFVLGYYWAHRSYGGQPARPRVGHRTGDQIDGQQDIASGLYRMGETDKTFGHYDSRAAIDFFQWEATLHAERIYPAAMDAPGGYNDESVIAGLQSGELFLAPIDAMEAFNLHGGSHVGVVAGIDDPGDLEFASLPRGVSLELDAKGAPARTGVSTSFREDWVWALPISAGAPTLGYRFVQFLWRPEIHARECEALGMLPLHPQVVAERVTLFRLEWMSHVFEAAINQSHRGEAVPPALVGKGYGSVYAQLWTKIVGGGVAPTEAAIVAILRAPPAPRALADEAAEPDGGAAAPDEPAAAADDSDDASMVVPETEDWETDVVFEHRDAGVGDGGGGDARPTQRPATPATGGPR
jgi:hypothetical protein